MILIQIRSSRPGTSNIQPIHPVSLSGYKGPKKRNSKIERAASGCRDAYQDRDRTFANEGKGSWKQVCNDHVTHKIPWNFRAFIALLTIKSYITFVLFLLTKVKAMVCKCFFYREYSLCPEEISLKIGAARSDSRAQLDSLI